MADRISPLIALFDMLSKRHKLTIGVQAMITAPDGSILLVRHKCRPGWHFPGGDVEPNDSAPGALARELREELGIVALARPTLFGLYSHFAEFPNDHIALYLVKTWEQTASARPNFEIAEHRFFAPDALPEDTSSGTLRRIREVLNGLPPTIAW